MPGYSTPSPSPATTVRRTVRFAASFLAAAALAGCAGADDDAGAMTDESAAVSAGFTAAAPWARVAIRPEPTDAADASPVNSAAYLVLRNAGGADDALVAVETEVAEAAEIHSVSVDGGVMRMRQVDSVAVPAGGETVLEPGGHHVMLIGIRRALVEGDSVRLTLRFRGGDSVRVVAPVLRSPSTRR